MERVILPEPFTSVDLPMSNVKPLHEYFRVMYVHYTRYSSVSTGSLMNGVGRASLLGGMRMVKRNWRDKDMEDISANSQRCDMHS